MDHYPCPECGACYACGNECDCLSRPVDEFGQKQWEDYVDEYGYG